MQIADSAKALIKNELYQLAKSRKYFLLPQTRIDIYAALGVSNVNDEKVLDEAHSNDSFPHLLVADRIRANIALITARKVALLWENACQESESYFKEQDWQDKHKDQDQEEVYRRRSKNQPIEEISVYEVPRAFIPFHILDMAEIALTGKIQNQRAFLRQANEWWQIYGHPKQMEREFFIKSAAQDALYEAIGWIKYNLKPPAENALCAFAGIFDGESFEDRNCTFDENKQHEFWVWWLSEAIPQAHEKV